MRNTTAASAASGNPPRNPVAAAHTTTTSTTDASCASWLRPPAPTTICVLVGLPFTTKVPVTAAARLAPPSASMSASVSTCSSNRAA